MTLPDRRWVAAAAAVLPLSTLHTRRAVPPRVVGLGCVAAYVVHLVLAPGRPA